MHVVSVVLWCFEQCHVHMCSGKGKRGASSSRSGTLQTPARFTGGGGSISSRSKTPGTFKTPHTPATRKTPKTPFTSASVTPALDNACSVIVGMADWVLELNNNYWAKGVNNVHNHTSVTTACLRRGGTVLPCAFVSLWDFFICKHTLRNRMRQAQNACAESTNKGVAFVKSYLACK